jgi:hypothetical protein
MHNLLSKLAFIIKAIHYDVKKYEIVVVLYCAMYA